MVSEIMIRIVMTSDGSHTLFVPGMDEHYHSVHGAIQESEYIFIDCGFKLCKRDHVRIFEAGFGTGLNVLLTAMSSHSAKKEVHYVSMEKYPLAESIIESLNYRDFVNDMGKEIFNRIHSCRWNVPEYITTNFVLHKIKDDLVTSKLSGTFDLIYFDAFGPDKQPEIWTEEVFKKISGITDHNGVLLTYSAKGAVQRILKKNGFIVDLLPGPPGKRQIIRAIKI
jgi:tRNA U34 5-methylaminomethyl-2-thiouridine-forming methyltransferase MnmC